MAASFNLVLFILGTWWVIGTRSAVEVRCDDGTKIDAQWRCDGYQDCNDGSDEKNCPVVACDIDQFQCSTTGKCVSLALRCNGEVNCDEDDSDEEGCQDEESRDAESAEAVTCGEEEFRCHRSIREQASCIGADWVCDGSRDCEDGEDEEGCDCEKEGRVRCASSSKCIDPDYLCDGETDCPNGEDETGCPTPPSRTTAVVTSPHPGEAEVCGSNEFACDGTCFRAIKACDQYEDCIDGADESDEVCHSQQCTVRAEVRGRGEGGADRVVCDHGCRPTPSGPRCYCFSGFALEGDGRSCKVAGRQTPFLYFAADNRILKQSLTGRSRELVVHVVSNSSTNRIASIDFDLRKRIMFWIDDFSRTIHAKDSSGNVKTLLKFDGDETEVTSFAYDWTMDNLYVLESNPYTDRGKLKLYTVASSTGNRLYEINTDHLQRPMFIALNPNNKVIAIVDIVSDNDDNAIGDGKKSSVLLFGMDGSYVRTVHTSRTDETVTALTVDQLTNTLYWSLKTRQGKTLFYLFDLRDLDSKPYVRSLTHRLNPVRRLTSLAVFNKDLIFSDTQTRQIWRVDSLTAKPNSPDHHSGPLVRMAGERKLGALFVAHLTMQPKTHKDSTAKKCYLLGCSHLCLDSPAGVVCLCPDDMELSTDNKRTCISSTTTTTITKTTTRKSTTTTTTTTTTSAAPSSPIRCKLGANMERVESRRKTIKPGDEVEVKCESGYFIEDSAPLQSARFTCGKDGQLTSVGEPRHAFKCAPFSCRRDAQCGRNGSCKTYPKTGTSFCLCFSEDGTSERVLDACPDRPRPSSTTGVETSSFHRSGPGGGSSAGVMAGVVVTVVVFLTAILLLTFKFCRPKLQTASPWVRLYNPENVGAEDGKGITNSNETEYEMRDQPPPSPVHVVKFSGDKKHCTDLSRDSYYFKALSEENEEENEDEGVKEDTDTVRNGSR